MLGQPPKRPDTVRAAMEAARDRQPLLEATTSPPERERRRTTLRRWRSGGDRGDVTTVRPPGSYNETTQASIDYLLILWDVDTDWQHRTPRDHQAAVSGPARQHRAFPRHPPAHGTPPRSARQLRQGYHFVTVTELFGGRTQPGVWLTLGATDRHSAARKPTDLWQRAQLELSPSPARGIMFVRPASQWGKLGEPPSRPHRARQQRVRSSQRAPRRGAAPAGKAVAGVPPWTSACERFPGGMFY